MRGLMSFRDRFRKGVFTNVFLHAKLEARYADRPGQVKQEVKRVFKKELFVANVRKMRKLVERLAVGPAAGRLDRLRRAQQLHGRRRAAQGRVRARGGRLARVAARLGHRREQRPLLAHRGRGRAAPCVAVDADQGPVELLYRDLQQPRATSRSSRSR